MGIISKWVEEQIELKKTCTNCGKEKDVSEFYVNKNTRDKLQSWCKECMINYKSKDKKDKQIEEGMKKCSSCGEIKSLTEFNKHSRNKDGLNYYCKLCARKYEKEYKDKKRNMLKVIENKELELKLIDGEVYANANSMTDSTTLDNWKRSANTERYINALNQSVKSTEWILSKVGGNHTGTWIHEKLILSLARYISVEFEIWCDNKISEFISGNKPKQIEKTTPTNYIEALKQLVESEERRIEVEKKNAILMHVNKTYRMTEIAKELNLKSATELNKILKEKKIQYKVNGTWVMYGEYSDRGYENIKQQVLDNGKVIYDRKITQLGRDFILGLFD